MFDWWRERQREKILRAPFPAAWTQVLERNVKHYARLPPEQQKTLRELVQVFVAEKHWEGCGGLALTDEMKVTIAAQACLLVLARPHRLYQDVESIFVYPSAVMRPAAQPGVFVRPRELVASGPTALLGEAHVRGPVILAWDRVLRDGKNPHDGHNLVYHEFAHKLDMEDGHADGTPELESRAQIQRWREVCERSFLTLQKRTERGEPSFLDAYGATNEAEFFAVATEQFFDRPRALQRADEDLYEILAGFYRQDPASLAPED
ncbi:MAG TPA: M90 family metallopeptidase [Polyangiales bacterium]